MPLLLGSGLAAYGAGEGPCGHDPEDAPSDKVVQTPVSALFFDPFDRVYKQNADLSMVAGTGPLQRAAHLLLPLAGLPAVASSGLNIARIRRALPSQRKRVIEDELRIAWKPLLQSGQIAMGAVTLEDSKPWSGRFYVEATDLVTPAAEQRAVSLNGKV